MPMALMNSISILLAGAPAFGPAVALAGAFAGAFARAPAFAPAVAPARGFAGAFAVSSAAVCNGGKSPGWMMVMSATVAASATITSAGVAGKSPGNLMVISASVADSAAIASPAVASSVSSFVFSPDSVASVCLSKLPHLEPPRLEHGVIECPKA